LDAIVAEMRRFHSGMIDLWDTHDARFKAALRGIPPERIDRLALYLPEDTVSVRFRDAGSSNDWRSLSQGSPGQQTAALLAFVLGFGNEPIILDQPEDDLDSTLIYELLVNRFRELKATRQMIVVTHNPNIVVHGDAEYVVSLDVPNGETTVRCSGGLQEISVRDEICRVMEGGREAFQSRYHRIISPTGAE
jgi:energy-coupling factor transporter ATP-binding protein EcfA2